MELAGCCCSCSITAAVLAICQVRFNDSLALGPPPVGRSGLDSTPHQPSQVVTLLLTLSSSSQWPATGGHPFHGRGGRTPAWQPLGATTLRPSPIP